MHGRLTVAITTHCFKFEWFPARTLGASLGQKGKWVVVKTKDRIARHGSIWATGHPIPISLELTQQRLLSSVIGREEKIASMEAKGCLIFFVRNNTI